MTSTAQEELKNAIIKVQYNIICDLFGLSESQRLSLNAGAWIVDCIKQYQTSSMLAKAVKLNTDTTSVEKYNEPVIMPPLPQHEEK